jgi:hypothetical protein
MAIASIRETGVQLETGFIPIDPFATLQELKQTVEFIEKNKLEDTIVKVLNLMCVQRGALNFHKVDKEGLILGARNFDTLLYPYKINNPEIATIRRVAEQWLQETLRFIYALRRKVDASKEGILEEKYLHQFRKIDFELLKRSTHLYNIDTLEKHDINQIRQTLMKLNVCKNDISSIITVLRKYEKKPLRKQEKAICVQLFLNTFRNIRNTLIERIAVAIEKGDIADSEGFLRKGIIEIVGFNRRFVYKES